MPSELEKLIEQAESDAKTPVTNVPKPCEHPYSEATHKKCPTCLWSFCADCASPLDPQYCQNCLNEPDAQLHSEPLVDVDGVTHEGRHIQPDPNGRFFQPRFGTLAKTISEMTDAELEEYVLRYKNLVHQAEVALDFRRVVLGSSQIEVAQRADRKRRALRADKTKYPVKTLTIDKKTGDVKKKPVDMSGVLKMMEMLQALQAKVKQDKQNKDGNK